jgi:hypothetical protein
MGPISLDWYRKRGLTTLEHHVQEQDNPYTGRKAGELYTLELINHNYSCGRIDVRGTSDSYGEEIGVPPMLSLDWARFGRWLDTLETDAVWTLDQLVKLYERDNPKITWDTYSE